MSPSRLRLLAAGAVFMGLSTATPCSLFAGDPPDRSYAVTPLLLLTGSGTHAVVRENWTSFEVFNPGKARLKVLTAVTVLAPGGRDRGELHLDYGRFRTIGDLDGRIIGSDGEKVRSLQSSDIHDMSAFSSISLYTDARVRTAALYYDRYPYTVVYEFEEDFNGILAWPDWEAQGGADPVEHSSFELILHDTTQLRYWTNADSIKPVITRDGGECTYRWEASNIPEMSDAARDEDPVGRTLVVVPGPVDFEMEGFKGNMRSWNSFGSWSTDLFRGRDVLPQRVKDEVHRITSTSTFPREIAVGLYLYLQKNTRYVSVQLGIGGWQPFDATYVSEHGYGDCKALSNYMVSLLKEAGIRSYPVLIHAGSLRSEVYLEDFPNQQFNHVIVCVPFEQDTLWLECTDQSTPPGHLGDFTEGRFALLLNEHGGVPVRTPATLPAANVRRLKARAILDFTGSAAVFGTTIYTGNQQDYVRAALVDASPEQRTHWMHDHLRVSNAELGVYRTTGIDTPSPIVTVGVDFTVPRLAQITGARMFLMPNMMHRDTYIPPVNTHRRSPVRPDYAYRDIDTIRYVLPRGFAIEALPPPVDLVTSFGEFHERCIPSGDSLLTYTRWDEIRQTPIPASAYNEYRDFCGAIVKADRAQAVLTRKGG